MERRLDLRGGAKGESRNAEILRAKLLSSERVNYGGLRGTWSFRMLNVLAFNAHSVGLPRLQRSVGARPFGIIGIRESKRMP